MSNSREIAAAVVVDFSGRLLLQQRDDVPGILHPGKVGLFGGHREGDETFLDCVARELNEELSYAIPQERFEHLLSYEGSDWDVSSGTLRAEFFVVAGIPLTKLKVTEGKLLVVDESTNLDDLKAKLAPSALQALAAYAGKQGAFSKLSVCVGGLTGVYHADDAADSE